MKKSLIAAAAFAALAAGFSGGANAATVGGGLGGIKSAAVNEATQVHYRPYHHRHWKKWRHHNRWHGKKCVWRHGHRHCWWR